MSWLALALQLSLASSEDGRGAPGLPPDVAQARRLAPRVHAALAVGGAAGLARSGSAYGLALAGDLGLVLSDRLSVVAHGVVSSLVFTFHGALGVRVDYALGDRWSVGAGAAFTGWLNGLPGLYANWLGVTFPLRVSYLLQARAPTQVPRAGLSASLEVGPGLDLRPTTFVGFGTSVPQEFGATVLLSLGYVVR